MCVWLLLGVVTTLAGTITAGHADGTTSTASFNYPNGIYVDSWGIVYVADTNNDLIRKILPTGCLFLILFSSQSQDPSTVDDLCLKFVLLLCNVGHVVTIAGNWRSPSYQDGSGTNAKFFRPNGIVVGLQGLIYVSDGQSSVIRVISPNGMPRHK